MPPGEDQPDHRPEAAASPDASGEPGSDVVERRRFPRIRLALTVRLRFPSTEAVLESRTVDISEGGVFIRMPQPRGEGTAIRLQLEVGERQLELGGVVVRCVRSEDGEPAGIGVLFTAMSPEDAEFMKGLVRERLDEG